MYYIFLIYFFKIVLCISDYVESLREINCKDNDNFNVDWWYIYKPPFDQLPIYTVGRDFIYISSYKAGRWLHSGRHITTDTMLQRTLAPLYSQSSDSLAIISYEEKNPKRVNQESSLFGLLIVNELGGIWLRHTIPGLIDWSRFTRSTDDESTKVPPSFPDEEIENGHLLMCLALDISTLNQLGPIIRASDPMFTRIQIPELLRSHLLDWDFSEYEEAKSLRPMQKILSFTSRMKSMVATILVRKPKDKFCPYARFAKKMNLVLDIYGHQNHNMPYCFANYSIRNIERISMKSVEYVHYIPRERDRMSFAVSTTAHWQRVGSSGINQYWTCIGPANDISDNGGILVCFDRFEIWQSFDNFKAIEPQC